MTLMPLHRMRAVIEPGRSTSMALATADAVGEPFDAPDAVAFPGQVRCYISADRLLRILSHRLGCVSTGERELYCTYWVTPDGRRFRLFDPIIDPIGRSTVTSGGRHQHVYTRQYARALLGYLIGDARR